MNRTRRLALVAAGVVGIAGVPAVGSLAGSNAPACFGAAARDAARPCDNPALRFSATPTPQDAPLQPNSACTPVRSALPPRVCSFGVAKARARATVVLLGDSHAPAWRAAVEVLARDQGWRGLTVRRSSCPFTRAGRAVSQEATASCSAWIRDVLRWFRRHREVHTVFVADSSAYSFVPAQGQDAHATAVAGYRAALDALPASVRHIVVIRDNPKAVDATLPCVGRALARHQRADLRCALARASSLLPDALAEAAPQLTGDRGRAIDLSRFFCDDRLCYPVVGGVLVYKDTSHITKTFSGTLGPHLKREYRALGLPPA